MADTVRSSTYIQRCLRVKLFTNYIFQNVMFFKNLFILLASCFHLSAFSQLMCFICTRVTLTKKSYCRHTSAFHVHHLYLTNYVTIYTS